VTSYDGPTVLGISTALNGQAVLRTVVLQPGSRRLHAHRMGTGSGDSNIVTQTVNAVGAYALQAPIGVMTPFSGPPVVADFDGDGKPDIIIPSGGAIAVLLGKNIGSSNAPVTYFASAPINWLAVGDFNGDGLLDLAASGGGIVILLGKGDGSFRTPVSVMPPGPTRLIVSADLDGDGILDLAFQFGGGLQTMRGRGDGTFYPAVDLALEISNTFLVVTDFNSDDKPDIAVSLDSRHSIGVLLGRGDGTFQTPVYSGSSTLPVRIRISREGLFR